MTTKWSNRPTAKARQMLIDGKPYGEIVDATGLVIQSVRAIASKMRKDGVGIPVAQRRYEYTGVNKTGQAVRFSSLSEGEGQGFKSSYVSMCVNGHRDSYVGYTWSRVEV